MKITEKLNPAQQYFCRIWLEGSRQIIKNVPARIRSTKIVLIILSRISEILRLIGIIGSASPSNTSRSIGTRFVNGIALGSFKFYWIWLAFFFAMGNNVLGSAVEYPTLRQDFHSKMKNCLYDRNGAVIRMDTTSKSVYLIFSADEFGEGAVKILEALKNENVKGSFFLTGNFLRNKNFRNIIHRIQAEGHYLGPHSDRHLLYNAWENADSLLVTRSRFREDLRNNLKEIRRVGGTPSKTTFFLPPYEWCNLIICKWSADMNKIVVNLTPGTATNADYTTPDMTNYKSSGLLTERLFRFESSAHSGLNGAIILIHLGTHPDRKDKLYDHLDMIIDYLREKGYTFERFK
jgi:peptidoglycan/xylan/chitin deacetylase (PgdA/CDA1 family)